ncbi:MAG: DUF413 domain-containing protein [Aeromonas sp.]
MSFASDKRFTDMQHFPRGLRRSGEFTVAEATQLETYGVAMQALASGALAPRDEVENAFVAQVHSGMAGGNPLAKVWLKYLKVIAPKRVHRLGTHSPGGGEDGASTADVVSGSDNEHDSDSPEA